ALGSVTAAIRGDACRLEACGAKENCRRAEVRAPRDIVVESQRRGEDRERLARIGRVMEERIARMRRGLAWLAKSGGHVGGRAGDSDDVRTDRGHSGASGDVGAYCVEAGALKPERTAAGGRSVIFSARCLFVIERYLGQFGLSQFFDELADI